MRWQIEKRPPKNITRVIKIIVVAFFRASINISSVTYSKLSEKKVYYHVTFFEL
ncbi:hypothetical protein Hanom_Chr14g01310181 [Helianthus anomalus]